MALLKEEKADAIYPHFSSFVPSVEKTLPFPIERC
jgi:hypothetical protein